MKEYNLLEKLDNTKKLNYNSLLSNTSYSVLIIVLMVKYIITKHRDWLYQAINALIIITLFGSLFRDVLTTLNVYDKRPMYENITITNKYETNGMPSLHAMSIGYIIPFIMKSNLNPKIKALCCLCGFYSLYLRYESKLHSIKQLVVGFCIGIILNKVINIKTVTNLYLYISSLLIVKYFLIQRQFNSIKQEPERVPNWFDSSLLESYDKKLSKNNDNVHFRNYAIRCQSPFYYKNKTYALPYILKWSDVEEGLDKFHFDTVPDIMVGIKSGGAFITKYLAEKYNVQYDYISIKKYDKSNMITIANKMLRNEFCRDMECIYRNDKLEIKEHLKLDVKDKNVLLIDDTISSGSTLYKAKKYMFEEGAKDVKTFVFTQHSKNDLIDYSVHNNNFIGWPWGMDA